MIKIMKGWKVLLGSVIKAGSLNAWQNNYIDHIYND